MLWHPKYLAQQCRGLQYKTAGKLPRLPAAPAHLFQIKFNEIHNASIRNES